MRQVDDPGVSGEKIDIADFVVREWDRSRIARASLRFIVLDERSFVYRLNHYSDEWLNQERNKHRVRPRGRQLKKAINHAVSEIANSPLNLDTIPAAPNTTPEMNETGKAIATNLVGPHSHYKRHRRRVVSSAAVSRAGAMMWHVSYDADGNPSVRPRFIDALNVHWAPGFSDPDDPECPWVIIEDFQGIERVRSMKEFEGWTIPDDLHVDGAAPASEGDGLTARSDIMSGTVQGAAGGLMTNYRKLDGVRLLYCWFRRDETRKKVPSGEFVKLQPDEQYMACGSCGWRSNPGETTPTDKCPECGTTPDVVQPDGTPMFGPVTKESVLDSVLAYPKGRLVVVASEQKKLLYDDKWPYDMRDINLLWYPWYEDPFAQWGTSETTDGRDTQCVLNALDRSHYEAALRAKPVIITTNDLYKPNSNTVWEPSDDPVSVAIWKGQGAPVIEFFKPEPVPASAMQLRNMLAADFRNDMPNSDISLKGDQMKGVRATVADLAFKTGEVPVDDHIAQLQEREGPFIGVGMDIWCSVNRKRTQVAVPDDVGNLQWVTIRGGDLPRYQVNVSSGADFKGAGQDVREAVNMLLQVPPPERMWVGKALGFPPSVMKEVQKAQADQQAQQQQMMAQQQAAQGGMPSGAGPSGNGAAAVAPPPGGPPMPPAIMQRMAQMQGAGR